MRWPLVHRARLEAAERQIWHLDTALAIEQTRATKLLSDLLHMKQQGFSALPPKIAPQAGTSEDGYMKRELAAQKGPDPFIEGLLAEGRTLEEAVAIRKQAQQDFKAGEM